MHFDELLKLTRFLLFICINAHCLKLSRAELLKATSDCQNNLCVRLFWQSDSSIKPPLLLLLSYTLNKIRAGIVPCLCVNTQSEPTCWILIFGCVMMTALTVVRCLLFS